ncbi:hypothetical protein OAN18_04950 [Nitrosopumilus sp.]|nr:hypothetical protein [Nitrosopumilus sp.]
MTSADKLGMIVAVAVVIIFVGLGVGMSNVTPDTPRPSMEQQAMAPKIIESSSKEKIPKESSMKLKVKSDDKKLPTKLHKISKDLKDKKMKLKSKLSPEIKERVKAITDSWEIKKIIPLESPRPITEEYFGECISEPPPGFESRALTDWDHCDISYLEHYGPDHYTDFTDTPYTEDAQISMINSNARQMIFYNWNLYNINGVSSDLSLSEFENVNMVNANFNFAEIGGIHFINSYLDTVNFSNTDCNEIIPGTSDYYPCIFDNVNSRYFLGKFTNWKNVYILDSQIYPNLRGSNLSEITILNSDFSAWGSAQNINNISITNSIVSLATTDGEIENVNLENSSLWMNYIQDSDLSEITTNNSIFQLESKRGSFNNVIMNNTATELYFLGTEMNNVMISNGGHHVLNCSDKVFWRLYEIFEPRCIPVADGVDGEHPLGLDNIAIIVEYGSMNNVVIEDSNFESLSFSDLEMNNVTIKDSIITSLSIGGLEMNNVEIIDSVIHGANFQDVDLSTTDLSGTEIIDGYFSGVTTGDTPLGCTGHPICD